MSVRVTQLRVFGADLSVVLGRTLLLLALLALVYLAVRVALAGSELASALGTLKWQPTVSLLLLATGTYLTGHGLRILRLALLIGGWRIGFRDLASFHLTTSAVSLAIPMKLGEVYRVLELSNIAGGLVRAIVIVWCERAFDTIVILAMLVLALSNVSGALPQFGAVVALAAAFIAVTAIIIFLAPDNLRRLAVFIVRRHDSKATVPVLHGIDTVRRAILEAPRLLQEKVASLATLTVLIWGCELISFALALPAVGGSLNMALDGLLAFLSAITRGETLLHLLDLDAGQRGAGGAQLLSYMAATQVPLLVCGLIAAAHYVRLRLRT
ncbi:MAG TPA: lysylphosphatidylglycerol synthase domain-containing protein [Steroidobacter sp.]|uniref:lysylphosphatidylglycerol synthase domain-containing protein n=1 Tax=Steroidobacter sp. TaxID=1978227 RepID=UPI002ED8D5A4